MDRNAAAYVSPIRNGGMARGVVSGMRPVGYPSERQSNVFVTSIASRIRGYYEGLPEAPKSVPCVDPNLSNQEGRFEGPAMKLLHSFALSAGGGVGRSHADKIMNGQKAA